MQWFSLKDEEDVSAHSQSENGNCIGLGFFGGWGLVFKRLTGTSAAFPDAR